MSVLFVENLRFLDTTLRDGEQTPGVSLNPDQKFEIASRLSDIGVDVIEAGSAAASDGEREAIRQIADAGLAAEICTFVRALHGDIDYAADCGADSIHLVVPVSDLHIAKKMRKTREEVVAMAMDAVEYAKDRGLIVELSGEDASRADQQFLHAIFSSGVEHGADRLCFCDTVGLLTPEKVAEFHPAACRDRPALDPLPRRPRVCRDQHDGGLESRRLLRPRDRQRPWRAGGQYAVRGSRDGA